MTREEAFEILGLNSDASLDDARTAYHALAKHYHPDKNTAPNAAVMFRMIHDAWEVIQNHIEREHAEDEAGRKHSETSADTEEPIKRKRKKVERRIRWSFMIAWVIFWVVFPRIILSEFEIHDWPGFLVSISLVGITLNEIIIGTRRWFKGI